jgi:plastocyanin
MTTTSIRTARRLATATLVGAALALTACGSDDGSDAASDDTGAAPDEGASTTESPAADGVVEVELADFAFEGLPASVPAGTRLTVTNTSEVELHKLSAIPIPDDEDRPAEELVALPPAELAAILQVLPATVLAAGPGGPQVDELGDGTLSAPGRYALICAIPLGLDPGGYLDARPADRRAQIRDGSQPHFALGMVADLVVE